MCALYDNSKPLGMGLLHYTPEPMSREDAEAMLAEHAYFDYCRGRVMKVDLSGGTLDPRLYDRDNGPGAAQFAIDMLRSPEAEA